MNISAPNGSSDPVGPASDRVYGDIYRRISSDEWPKGTRLPTELDLAEMFGVSRTVVREALLRLKIDGVIASRQGAGNFVTAKPPRTALEFTTPGSIADIQRCYEFRVGIEGEAAALAARNATPDCVREMEDALQSLRVGMANGALGGEEDIAFHLAVARATQNSYYIATIESATKAIMIGMTIACTLSSRPAAERLEVVYREHLAIFDSIRANDAALARSRMRLHIDRARLRVFVGNETSPSPD